MSKFLMNFLLRYSILLSMLYIITINTININRRPEREISSSVEFVNKTHHHMHLKYFTRKQENVASNSIKYNSKLNNSQIEKSDKTTIHVHHVSFSNKSAIVTLNKNCDSIKIFKEVKIIKVLFVIYILVAVPLWCTKVLPLNMQCLQFAEKWGTVKSVVTLSSQVPSVYSVMYSGKLSWCCCFLFCKIFKPDKTIEEAKKFLEFNPPGVLFHKETLIHYEPSANEKYCYEKLDYLIRTI